MKPLTDRQRKVLEFIRKYIREQQRPPSFREICAHFGYSGANAANNHIAALEKKGYLRREGINGQSRTIKLLDEPRGIPLLTLEQLSR